MCRLPWDSLCCCGRCCLPEIHRKATNWLDGSYAAMSFQSHYDVLMCRRQFHWNHITKKNYKQSKFWCCTAWEGEVCVFPAPRTKPRNPLEAISNIKFPAEVSFKSVYQRSAEAVPLSPGLGFTSLRYEYRPAVFHMEIKGLLSVQNALTFTGFGKHTDINAFVFLCVVSTFFASWKKYIKLHNTVDISEISKDIWNKVTVHK